MPVFAGLSLLLEGTSGYAWKAGAVLGVLYQGVVVAGACFIILVHLLTRHSAGRLGVYGFVTPAVGVALSMWILDEAPTPAVVGSMALVAAGIAVSQTAPRTAEPRRA